MSKHLALLKTRTREFNFLDITDKKTLICKLCGIEFKHAERKTHIVQHSKTEKHKNLSITGAPVQNNFKNSRARSEHPQQGSLQDDGSCRYSLVEGTKCRVSAVFSRSLLTKVARWKYSQESRDSRALLGQVVRDKAEFKDKFLWVAIDEATDVCGRYVVNVVAGPLDDSLKVRKGNFELYY